MFFRPTSFPVFRRQYLALILIDRLLERVCCNLNCAQGKRSLHSRRNFISISTAIHDHDDDRWPTEVTQNTSLFGDVTGEPDGTLRRIMNVMIHVSRKAANGCHRNELGRISSTIRCPNRGGNLRVRSCRGRLHSIPRVWSSVTISKEKRLVQFTHQTAPPPPPPPLLPPHPFLVQIRRNNKGARNNQRVRPRGGSPSPTCPAPPLARCPVLPENKQKARQAAVKRLHTPYSAEVNYLGQLAHDLVESSKELSLGHVVSLYQGV